MGTSVSFLELLNQAKWYIVAVLLASYIAREVRSYRRLSHIKGPWLAQFSQFWLLNTIYQQKAHYVFNNVRKKYGKIARIGTNMLITCDIDLFTRMNAVRSSYKRSEWYLGFRLAPGIDNVGSLRNEKEHTKRRAQMSPGYTGRDGIDFEPNIDIHVQNFIDLIRTKYISTTTESNIMDLAQKAQFFTIDVITDLATGAPFGDLPSDSDQNEYLKTTTEAQAAFIMICSMPALTKIIQIPSIGKWLFPTSQDEIGMGKLIGIAEEKVVERFDPDSRKKLVKPDIIQSFINNGLTQEETLSESLLMILAGSDTTSSAIRATMLCILTSPLTYRTLQREIDSATLSTPVVRDEEARKLVYLQAVILEGIRDTINGVFIPGGVEIAVNTWGIMRDEDIFGPDPEMFRPERWLGLPEARYAEMARVVDLTFGSGRFKCLGKSVATIELNKIIVECMRNFDWAVVDPTNPWKSANIGIILQREFYVRVTERG